VLVVATTRRNRVGCCRTVQSNGRDSASRRAESAEPVRTGAGDPGCPVAVPAPAKGPGLGLGLEVVPDQDASGPEAQVPATQDPATQDRQAPAPAPSETAPVPAAVGWSRFPLFG
jgi:hypothetical protein